MGDKPPRRGARLSARLRVSAGGTNTAQRRFIAGLAEPGSHGRARTLDRIKLEASPRRSLPPAATVAPREPRQGRGPEGRFSAVRGGPRHRFGCGGNIGQELPARATSVASYYFPGLSLPPAPRPLLPVWQLEW
jgi:hypothetical protein